MKLKGTVEGTSTIGRSQWDSRWKTAEVGKAKGSGQGTSKEKLFNYQHGCSSPISGKKICPENRNLRQREQKKNLKQERLDEARQQARIEEEERIAVRDTFRKRHADTSLTTWNDKDILKLLISVIIVFCLVIRRLHWTQLSSFNLITATKATETADQGSWDLSRLILQSTQFKYSNVKQDSSNALLSRKTLLILRMRCPSGSQADFSLGER